MTPGNSYSLYAKLKCLVFGHDWDPRWRRRAVPGTTDVVFTPCHRCGAEKVEEPTYD